MTGIFGRWNKPRDGSPTATDFKGPSLFHLAQQVSQMGLRLEGTNLLTVTSSDSSLCHANQFNQPVRTRQVNGLRPASCHPLSFHRGKTGRLLYLVCLRQLREL